MSSQKSNNSGYNIQKRRLKSIGETVRGSGSKMKWGNIIPHVFYEYEYNNEDRAIVTCAAWNQFMTIIVRTKPTPYPRKALLKYWLSFPLDTSNRKANATKIPEGEKQILHCTIRIGEICTNSQLNSCQNVSLIRKKKKRAAKDQL